MFPEYSRNIPQIFVSKIFQGYPRNIAKLWKYFKKSKSWKNCFVGYPVTILILAVSSLASFSELYWNCFTFRVRFEMVHIDPLQLVKISKQHTIIIIIINLFCRVFNVSMSSELRQIFVIARVFDIMQIDNILYKNVLIAVIAAAHYYQRELSNLLPRIIKPSKSAIETLEQGLKPVQR